MNDKLAAVLERRILRLNNEFTIAKREGRGAAPFKRRARSLTDAWRQASP